MIRLAVLDLETDPFKPGRMVQPFLSGFHDGSRTITHWGPDCIARLCASLAKEPEPYVIYAHNGGRFDFFYFLPHLAVADMRIINGRIVQARLGAHELRDSYAIMPFPLADFDKETIDYNLMEPGIREKHKPEIMRYFQKDLTSLYTLVVAFHHEFGDKLTIGSTSMGELRKLHKFSCGGAQYDEKYRDRFYFGGRVQVFKPGITTGDIRVIDINSSYPNSMRNYLHPIGIGNEVSRGIEKNSCFVVAQGRNYGAFPMRQKNKSLDFETPYGEFCCSIHEWEAALETGSFKPTKVIKAYGWKDRGSFDTFVDHFYNSRLAAALSDDKIRVIFYKFVLNSAYGKFAQNPNNYFDWFLTKYGDFPKEWHECDKACVHPCRKLWTIAYNHESQYMIWKRPLQSLHWFNVATGASITGASRAVLLRGLSSVNEPLYCDTDSIIYRGTSKIESNDSQLGAWKLEGRGSMIAIAGKKAYALFDPSATPVDKKGRAREFVPGAGVVIKKANKGVRATGAEILRAAKGETIVIANSVPTFRFDGTHSFITRKFKATGKASK